MGFTGNGYKCKGKIYLFVTDFFPWKESVIFIFRPFFVSNNMPLKRVQCPIVSQVQNFGFNNSLKSLLYQLPPLSWLVLPVGSSSSSSRIFSAWKSCVRVSSLLLNLSVPFSNNWIVIFVIIQRHLSRSLGSSKKKIMRVYWSTRFPTQSSCPLT